MSPDEIHNWMQEPVEIDESYRLVLERDGARPQESEVMSPNEISAWVKAISPHQGLQFARACAQETHINWG